jgi:hypothetical protein
METLSLSAGGAMYANAQTVGPLAAILSFPLNASEFITLGCARLDVPKVERQVSVSCLHAGLRCSRKE